MERRRDRGLPQHLLPIGLLLTLALAGCGDGDGSSASTAAPAAAPAAPASAAATSGASAASSSVSSQSAPNISGIPNTQALINQRYTFQPSATDANGDSLSFSVVGKPSWMTFNTANGRLSGTPAAGDVRTYTGISIRVSDGAGATALQPFSIEVVGVGQKAITLSWVPPTQNDDGSALRNLAGYKIRYGIESGEYDTLIDLKNPGLTTHMMENLVPSTYYFVISAYNASGVESGFSNPARVTVN